VNFFLCFVKTRKKLDKYFKINKIRNKYVIDIKKILDEEGINPDNTDDMVFFYTIIWKKIQVAQEKKKDIYYIPNFSNPGLDIEKLLRIKQIDVIETQNFNLLLFYQEFNGTVWLSDLLNNLSMFTNSQIIKDY
jgi:hypothetical protein